VPLSNLIAGSVSSLMTFRRSIVQFSHHILYSATREDYLSYFIPSVTFQYTVPHSERFSLNPVAFIHWAAVAARFPLPAEWANRSVIQFSESLDPSRPRLQLL
jgi:hypothetical protein